jgi:surface antigen
MLCLGLGIGNQSGGPVMNKILVGLSIVAFIFGLASCSTTTTNNQGWQRKTTAMNDQGENVYQPNQAMNNGSPAPTMTGNAAPTNTGNTRLAGNLENSMDQYDRDKVAHALDKKIGKSTEWTNSSTGITYTVMPTQRLTLNGNRFCRKYRVTSMKNEAQREVAGVACVSETDGSWQVISQS